MFKINIKSSIILEVIIILLLIIGVFYGYFANIVKLTRLDFEAPYKAEIIRVIGLIPVVGMVVGYIDIEDGKLLTKERTLPSGK